MPKRVTFDTLVDREARSLAREIIETRLEEKNLPLPKDYALDIHITHLLAIDPSIIDRARQRVEAKTDARSEYLRAIGVKIDVGRVIEIEIPEEIPPEIPATDLNEDLPP